MESYRSGHNEAVLKTAWVHAHVGSNPTLSAKGQPCAKPAPASKMGPVSGNMRNIHFLSRHNAFALQNAAFVTMQ